MMDSQNLFRIQVPWPLVPNIGAWYGYISNLRYTAHSPIWQGQCQDIACLFRQNAYHIHYHRPYKSSAEGVSIRKEILVPDSLSTSGPKNAGRASNEAEIPYPVQYLQTNPAQPGMISQIPNTRNVHLPQRTDHLIYRFSAASPFHNPDGPNGRDITR